MDSGPGPEGKSAERRASTRKRLYDPGMHSLFALLLFSMSAEAATKPAPFATVAAVQGLASLEPEHTNLQVGQELAEGARITVMHDSSVRLLMADGIALQVGPNSELELKRNKEKVTVLGLVHGMVLSVLKPATKIGKKDRFILKAPKVTMGVRGTEFFVKQDLNQPAFLCVCSGKVHTKWEKGELHLHSTKPHEHYVHVHHTRKKAQKAGDMGSDHTDKQLEALRALLSP